MSKRSLTMAAALLLSYFVAGIQTASAGGLDNKLPALDGLVRYGCVVQGPIQQIDHGDPSGRTRTVWSVTFWAEHISAFGKKARKDWKLLYSFRKKRIKGLTCIRELDCRRERGRERLLTGAELRLGLTVPITPPNNCANLCTRNPLKSRQICL